MISSPATGSSPRMRGKPTFLTLDLPAARLIPAHAGKTPSRFLSSASKRAHPRACGENSDPPFSTLWIKGSSPRMRGKHAGGVTAEGGLGLIPAHAGKTCGPAAGWSGAGAHPRACGENAESNLALAQLEGSSPRMRGKPSRVATRSLRDRLIPAHAGKTAKRASL